MLSVHVRSWHLAGGVNGTHEDTHHNLMSKWVRWQGPLKTPGSGHRLREIILAWMGFCENSNIISCSPAFNPLKADKLQSCSWKKKSLQFSSPAFVCKDCCSCQLTAVFAGIERKKKSWYEASKFTAGPWDSLQSVFREHLLCAGHCFQCEFTSVSETDKDLCTQGAYYLAGWKIRNRINK